MRQPNPSTPILIILPALALIPVMSGILTGLHNGGITVLLGFFYASLHPSLEPIVIQSALRGLQITVATALISWVISTFSGLILGLLSSRIFWHVFGFPEWRSKTIRRLLAIPRSIHELIWGLLLLQLFGLSPWVAIIAISIPHSSLIARVFCDQLESLDHSRLFALRQSGASQISALTTALLPPMLPIINSYGGYRLECALRGATLLGVFGMGGIGTELQLTLQSLQFREMWTSLWILGCVMLILETTLGWWRKAPSDSIQSERQLLISIGVMLILVVISLLWLQELDVSLISNFQWHPITGPTISEVKNAFFELPWLNLICNTLLMTLLAAGIAIGGPPLGMMIWPTRIGITCQSFVWSFLRLVPPPLSALLLLLCTSPSISVAALALGLQNLGVMGRLLKEGINHQSKDLYNAIHLSGSGKRIAWLYGALSPQSKSYLAYASYRTDVLLRETAVVGVVGGVGLGWQLQESLSSFDWAQVLFVTTAYSSLTLIGESMSERARQYMLNSTKNPPNPLLHN